MDPVALGLQTGLPAVNARRHRLSKLARFRSFPDGTFFVAVVPKPSVGTCGIDKGFTNNLEPIFSNLGQTPSVLSLHRNNT